MLETYEAMSVPVLECKSMYAMQGKCALLTKPWERCAASLRRGHYAFAGGREATATKLP